MTERKGNWLQTYTGAQFWPIDPRPAEIHIEDIAHSLSMQCRFSGHCRRFYSVAEHCVWISEYVPIKDALWGLLHDASEAYLVDIPRPIKPFLTNYKQLENKLMLCVCERFGLPNQQPESVSRADTSILTDEMRQNMAMPPKTWDTDGAPLGIQLQYWPPHIAEQIFLHKFERLFAVDAVNPPRHQQREDNGKRATG